MSTETIMKELPRISEEERQERRKGYEYAKASVGLEGYELTAEFDRLAKRYIDGEMDWEEFMELNLGKHEFPGT
jgi:hypothetical protein